MMKIEITVGENVNAEGTGKRGGQNRFKARAVTLVGAAAEALTTEWRTGATRRQASAEALIELFEDLQ